MKLTEGGNVFKDSKGVSLTAGINRKDLEQTLKALSPALGIPYKSTKGTLGLEDATLGSAGKTNAGVMGKKEILGDIDIAIDDSKYTKEEMYSRLSDKFENGDVVKSGTNICIKMPVAGDPDKGFVQVDLMFGKTDMMKWYWSSPDPESNSKYKGVYRNLLMAELFIVMRDKIRDPETQEIVAELGPLFSPGKQVKTIWRSKKQISGKILKNAKEISKQEFEEIYPEYKGKAKEMVIDTPESIVEFMFPGANLKPYDIDSYEKLKDAIIKYRPDVSDEVLKRFAHSMNKSKDYETPDDIKGFLNENYLERSIKKVLLEVRKVSLSMIQESIAEVGKFHKFREKCMKLIADGNDGDVFKKPKCNADMIPDHAMEYLLTKVNLNDDFVRLMKKDFGDNVDDKHIEMIKFYKDVVELIDEEDFFYIVDRYNFKITPESFICSLVDMDIN